MVQVQNCINNTCGSLLSVVPGLTFDGTNNLDNYVAWTTWTPTIIGQSTAGTTTYTLQAGVYTRIGNIVIAQFEVTCSAATGTGNANVGGLPINISNTANYVPNGSANLSGLTWPAGRTQITLYGVLNSATMAIQACGSAIAPAFVQMSNTAIDVQGTLVYRV